MKKRSVALLIAFIFTVAVLGACSNSNQGGTTSSSPVTSIPSYSEKITSSQTPSVASYDVKDNLNEWTYTDWQHADQTQKNKCLEFFQSEVGVNITLENLSKIFDTNQDKKLSDIIKIQKNNRSQSQQSGSSPSSGQPMQQDPGHGAAAGRQN